MQVQTWDAVFIRATRRRLHPVIADIAAWPGWWPGMTVSPSAGGFAVALRAPGLRSPQRRWSAMVTKNRPNLGITMQYWGAVTGEAEFYYLDERTGAVVHYLLRGQVSDRRWRAVVRDHRAGVRAGLHALKDRLEGDRLPGDEPDPALVAHQSRARADLARRAAAWEDSLTGVGRERGN